MGWRGLGLVVLWVLISAPAVAQPKLVGLFGTECDTPAWVAFGSLAEWDDFSAAAACSRRTGHRWVLQLHGPDQGDLEIHVREVRQRAEQAGLAPHLLALTFQEEWYERFRHGLLRTHAIWGAWDPATQEVAGVTALQAWLGTQHAAVHRGWPGLPVAWITTFVNNVEAYGPQLWAPLPAGVDVLALDPYTTATQTFEHWPEIVFAHAMATTTLPVAIVPQWFAAPGTTFETPRIDLTAGYQRWARHPRVIALWGFVWASRGTVVGLRELPALYAAVAQAFGPPVW